jgi:hypothetical protein
VLDSDDTPVACASEKEGAYKKGVFGLCPLLAFCDNTGESPARQLRPGDAGANDTADSIDTFARAVAQLPATFRRTILFRTDGAGFSCGLLKWIAAAGGRTHPSFTREYSTGWTFTQREMDAVMAPDQLAKKGQPVRKPSGTVTAACARTWPAGHRIFIRRELLHPRYAKDASAYELEHEVRLQAFATNTPGRRAAWLDCRHRNHTRVEGKIRDSKAESLARFPSRWMSVNQAWLTVTALACYLRAWLQLLACNSEMATATATPKTLCYPFLQVPAVSYAASADAA